MLHIYSANKLQLPAPPCPVSSNLLTHIGRLSASLVGIMGQAVPQEALQLELHSSSGRE